MVDVTKGFILIIPLFDEAFKYGDDGEFCAYVGTNAEPLCVQICKCVQCHIFVHYFTC
jgi:hypothetical protein